MASNIKRSSAKKSSAKSSVKKASVPKRKSVPAKKPSTPVKKVVKKTLPKTVSKKPVKTVKPKPVVKSVKPIDIDKNKVEAGKAFEKKFDEMAVKNTTIQKSGKSKKVTKFSIAAIIIIILAAIAYLLCPDKNISNIEESTTPKEPVSPTSETQIVAPQQEAARPVPENATIYTVKYKDQLTEISKQVYGSHKEWKRIYEANKDKIQNPNLIFPGQELIIPKSE